MTVYSSDPAYQQWMGALGFAQEEAERRNKDQREQITSDSSFQREGLGFDQDRMMETIGANFENRGITRSGEHLRRRAEGLRDSNRRFTSLEMGTARSLAAADASLEDQLADLRLRDANQQASAAARVGNRQGQVW